VLATLPEKDRKRTAALVIETLKCEGVNHKCNIASSECQLWLDKSALTDVINASKIMTEERKLSSRNLVLVLVHDVLLSNGIQAGDGPLKQAILRHKTRLHSEFQRIKVKRGVSLNDGLAQTGDARAGKYICMVRKSVLNLRLAFSSTHTSICPCKYHALDNPRSHKIIYLAGIC
jgi:putative methyltransferase